MIRIGGSRTSRFLWLLLWHIIVSYTDIEIIHNSANVGIAYIYYTIVDINFIEVFYTLSWGLFIGETLRSLLLIPWLFIRFFLQYAFSSGRGRCFDGLVY